MYTSYPLPKVGAVKTTIYLPDDLGDQVKNSAINVSAVCQRALREELAMTAQLQELDPGMERIELTADADGAFIDVAFSGRMIAESDDALQTIYLTSKHRFAVWDERSAHLSDYDTLEDLEDAGVSVPMLAKVAREVGAPRPVLELDI